MRTEERIMLAMILTTQKLAQHLPTYLFKDHLIMQPFDVNWLYVEVYWQIGDVCGYEKVFTWQLLSAWMFSPN